MRDPLQLLLILDLVPDNPIPLDEVLARLPDKRTDRKTFRLSDFGAKPAAPGASEPWSEWASAVTRMVEAARREAHPDGPPIHFYVAGRARLPVFAHLGQELSKWATITLLNQRPDHTWDVFPLQGTSSPPATEPFFSVVRGLNPETPFEAVGRVAVFITTGQSLNKGALRSFLQAQGSPLAGIVEVATRGQGTTWLDETHAAAAAAELTELIPCIRASYPHHTGLALFIAGPAPLAFMMGRAINPSLLADVWVPNFKAPSYHFALVLPHKGRALPPLSDAAEDELARRDILDLMLKGIESLRTELRPEHLPPLLSESDKAQLLARLSALEIPRKTEGDAFDLSVTEQRLVLGRGLLDALRKVKEAEVTRIGQSLLLHELFHFDQNLQSTTYTGIGRAGFALEEVDYWADTFALATLARWEILREGEKGQKPERVREIVTDHIDAALSGIEAFDRAEQGDHLTRLYERRLRRYLIWHLQRARALSLQNIEQAWQMLEKRLIVELAPLDGYLDERFDKLVQSPLSITELFIVLQGHLLRTPRQPSFDPAALVGAVRTFDRSALFAAMRTVRDHHHQVLVPWAR